jgi:hypothetical protein
LTADALHLHRIAATIRDGRRLFADDAELAALTLDLPRRHHRRGVVMSRERQLQLVGALNAWSRSIRRDECGDWRINGTSGHIYADPAGGWRLYVACRSARAWTAAKGRLGFCRVTQDGDDEGMLYLAAMPTKVQAAAIRKALGIRKRLEHSREALERMRRNAFQPAGKEGFSGQDARDGAGPGHPVQTVAPARFARRSVEAA